MFSATRACVICNPLYRFSKVVAICSKSYKIVGLTCQVIFCYVSPDKNDFSSGVSMGFSERKQHSSSVGSKKKKHMRFRPQGPGGIVELAACLFDDYGRRPRTRWYGRG